MPSTSRKQQRFMHAELARKKKGRRTKTGMSTSQLQDFAEAVVEHPVNRRKKSRRY